MPRTGAYSQIDFTLAPLQRVRALLEDVTTDPDYEGYDTKTLKDVRPVSATVEGNRARTVFELTIPKHLCNKRGNLHGGAACTLLDSLTATALHAIAQPGLFDAGYAARTINLTYLRPLPAGTAVSVECDIVASGKSLVHLTGIIKSLDGKVCVNSTHDKAIFSKKPEAKL